MTADHIFSRSVATLSAIAALATGVALTAAPSTARADGSVDRPPLQSFKLDDQDGLSFSDVVAEVQNGDQVVITAEVTVMGTAGKPRTGSVVFSSFMDYTDDVGIMEYTDDACTPSLMSRQAGAQACAAISRALRAAATAPAGPDAAPSTPTEGIIMRDGGICDPIRHMGC